jgi:excinuclease UvrABC helicase subunit UvrB
MVSGILLNFRKRDCIEETKPFLEQTTHSLVQSLYSRTEADFTPGNFRIKGDTVEVYPSYADDAEFIFLAMK